MHSTKQRVACIGLVCMDLVSVCKEFPREDTDQRVDSLSWKRGGNASNSAVVLSLLGSKVDFVGVVPISSDSNNASWGVSVARHAINDLKKNGVGVDYTATVPSEDFPTSMVLVNAQNGSRTIMHYRGNLPELSTDDLIRLDPNQFNWFHFESRRNLDVISSTIKRVREQNKELSVSLELEKVTTYNADPTLQFAKLADVVFMSKDFAANMGCTSAIAAVEHVHTLLPSVAVICTWGSAGAAYFDGRVSHQVEAKPVAEVVDTLGAGDSFIGGVIHAMCKGKTLGESVQFGCRVAERKISNFGFSHISGMSDAN